MRLEVRYYLSLSLSFSLYTYLYIYIYIYIHTIVFYDIILCYITSYYYVRYALPDARPGRGAEGTAHGVPLGHGADHDRERGDQTENPKPL